PATPHPSTLSLHDALPIFTILISAVVSLTLTPMMCARLLRHTPPERQGRLYRWSERAFDRIIAAYGTSLRWVLGHQPATLAVARSEEHTSELQSRSDLVCR